MNLDRYYYVTARIERPFKGSRSDQSLKVLLGLVQSHPNYNLAQLKVLFREHYPFGMRKYSPYAAWLKQQRLVMKLCKDFESRDKEPPAPNLDELPLFKK